MQKIDIKKVLKATDKKESIAAESKLKILYKVGCKGITTKDLLLYKITGKVVCFKHLHTAFFFQALCFSDRNNDHKNQVFL